MKKISTKYGNYPGKKNNSKTKNQGGRGRKDQNKWVGKGTGVMKMKRK